MRLTATLILMLTPVFCFAQNVERFEKQPDRVIVTLEEGELHLIPLSDNAMRIQFGNDFTNLKRELILTAPADIPKFEVSESPSEIKVSTLVMTAVVQKETGTISYVNSSGEVFLSETPSSRSIVSEPILGEEAYTVEQSFDSPTDEFLFGLGQFQDGHYNLKGKTRKLTQVNSQIAIPFVYSSRGYGLLWHQYGLTDFNPADNFIALEKHKTDEDEENVAEVTTTAGTQVLSQNQSLYTGTLTIPEDGKYSIMLDLGDMGNRHYVAIDGNPVINQENIWLPPTASETVFLKAGQHQVEVISMTDNNPKVSWNRIDNATTYRSPAADVLDYVVFYGPSADEVISSYRKLSGPTPMLPVWAYGFWQCRERYTSSEELVNTVKEFRDRKIPMDVIVQDWQYWGDKGWGVPVFDESNYPNPSEFIQEIHDLNAHFTVSIWSNPDRNSELGKEYVENGRFIKGTKWLDYFNPATRKEYWNTLKTNMFDNGVDAWWMDAVEPENDALKGEETYWGLGDFYRLTYPLMVSKSVFEGQREVTNEKRVTILTRSAFAGQQRYGTINWSGDVKGSWDGYRRQILAGLNFAMTGMPYWTSDIGGFFRPGASQYTDENYRELLTRWFQWGTLNPIFRIHGYQSETEIWKFGSEVEKNARKMLDLRYRLIPYIYSEAWNVHSEGSTMMRPMVMDFREDGQAVSQEYQYMFGKSFLVSPVFESGISEQEVYLPNTHDWYDFWSGKKYIGGTTVRADAPISKMPLFVKAGSIVPMGDFIQYTNQKPADTIEIRIYAGADGSFVLYEDEGDNYSYEKGAFSEIPFAWDDSSNTLTIGDRVGSFPGMLEERNFKIVLVDSDRGQGIDVSKKYDKEILYKGQKVEVSL